MRIFTFLLFISSSLICGAQTRDLYAEFSVPFNFGISTFKSKQNTSPASFLQENTKKFGGMWQPIKLELVYKEKVSAIVQYKTLSFNSKHDVVVDALAEQFPQYYIQGQSAYESVMSPAAWGTRFELVQYGLGLQRKLKNCNFIQLAGYYNRGIATLDSIDFSFKPNESNDYFIREFKFNDAKCQGFSAQLAYKIIAQSDDSDYSKPFYFVASLGVEYFY